MDLRDKLPMLNTKDGEIKVSASDVKKNLPLVIAARPTEIARVDSFWRREEEFEILENMEIEETLGESENDGSRSGWAFPEISYGFFTPETINRGKIEDQEVIVLIDCGATHNFIAQRVVDQLKIPVMETFNNGAVMGSGVAMSEKRVCKSVVLSLKELMIVEDFLPLDLSGVDIILGMKWLFTLSVTKVDWRMLTMCVANEGDSNLTKAMISLKQFMSSWDGSDEGYSVECRALQVTHAPRDG